MTIDVSLLLDGQLAPEETAAGLKRCAEDEQARDRFTLYALAGDAMRGNPFPDDGFSRRLFERMRSEGVKIEPGYDPLAGATGPR